MKYEVIDDASSYNTSHDLTGLARGNEPGFWLADDH